MLNHRVAAADAAHPLEESQPVTCPGERTMAARAKSMKEGIQVDENVWRQVQKLAGITV